jgi:hypothetical protein
MLSRYTEIWTLFHKIIQNIYFKHENYIHAIIDYLHITLQVVAEAEDSSGTQRKGTSIVGSNG